MNNKQFYQKLQEKLPDWQAQGWLDATASQHILSDTLKSANANPLKSHKLSLILGIMGVMLLAAGAISFFAANWQGMSKLFKLSLLFSSMTTAYLAAAWALSEQRYPALGQAFLLLGVLLFGNNIMLIAQIYHIDSHYPNGILLWMTGALLVTILMRSEAVFIAACVLALLWSGMETLEFRQWHYPWLLFLSLSVFISIRGHFKLATHVVVMSLFFWLLLNFDNLNRQIFEGIIVQLYALLGLMLFILSRVFSVRFKIAHFAECLSRYALIFTLIFLYVLSFPGLDLSVDLSSESTSGAIGEWWQLSKSIIIAVILLSCVGYFKFAKQSIPVYQWLGLLWLLIALTTLFFIPLQHFFIGQSESLSVIVINLLLFSLVIGLIHAGLVAHKLFYVNLAFILFTVLLISRYFDTFWSLMDRSLFFLVGGLVLILGGYWLEKKRRLLSLRLLGASDEN